VDVPKLEAVDQGIRYGYLWDRGRRLRRERWIRVPFARRCSSRNNGYVGIGVKLYTANRSRCRRGGIGGNAYYCAAYAYAPDNDSGPANSDSRATNRDSGPADRNGVSE
jgi:hypothetical protein